MFFNFGWKFSFINPLICFPAMHILLENRPGQTDINMVINSKNKCNQCYYMLVKNSFLSIKNPTFPFCNLTLCSAPLVEKRDRRKILLWSCWKKHNFWPQTRVLAVYHLYLRCVQCLRVFDILKVWCPMGVSCKTLCLSNYSHQST